MNPMYSISIHSNVNKDIIVKVNAPDNKQIKRPVNVKWVYNLNLITING